jgi:hypothetical protein
MGIGSIAAGFIQAAHADKDCSVGKVISGDAGPELGKAASASAHENGGNGETFSGYNQYCHSQ